jgi:hypothetical protein
MPVIVLRQSRRVYLAVDNLRRYKVEPRRCCFVIALKRGDVVHWLEMREIVEEFYDVTPLPGVLPPMLDFKTDEIHPSIAGSFVSGAAGGSGVSRRPSQVLQSSRGQCDGRHY